MSYNMQDTQVKTSSENRAIDATVEESKSKSTFNNAEYERWSQNLRNRTGSKSK